MRRLLAILATLVLLVLVAPPATSAPGADVSLRMRGMAPWVTPQDTDLGLVATATSAGPGVVGDLTFGLTMFTATRTRNQYEESLRRDPSDSRVLFASFDVVPGTLTPGQPRDLLLSENILKEVGEKLLQGDETAVYPLNIELRSGDETLASIRTPIVFLNFGKDQKVAETRLRLGWSFELHHPVDFNTHGTFLDTSLQEAVAPGGRLAQEVAALDALVNDPDTPRPVDVVWSPTLISQLQAMRDGYSVVSGASTVEVPPDQGGAKDAGAVLDAMHRLADGPLVESTALPYAVPNIPALLNAGLGIDLPVQLDRGRADVAAFTGKPLANDMFWPPAGYMDQATLSAVASRGVRTFLLTPGLVHREPQPKEFAQPATAALTSSLTGTVVGIVPDAGVSSLLRSPVAGRDPRLATQDILGELAQIWLEQPAYPRAVSFSVPESLDVPGGLFDPLTRLVGKAPWLQIQKVSAVVKNFAPNPDEPATLFPNQGPLFSPNYVNQIAQARSDIGLFRSILVSESTQPDQMESGVLLSEGASFADDQRAGLQFLGGIRGQLASQFLGIRPDTSRTVTLASGQGVVPIGIVNDTPNRVRVQVRLVSVRLEPAAKVQTVQLAADSTRLLPFRVKSRTTGRFPVQIRVLSPDGQALGPPDVLVVRSTSYNFFALLLVLGAAVFLLIWWARRFMPGSRKPKEPTPPAIPPRAKPA